MAVDWLQSRDFVILERNWRSGRSELDIVALDQHCLVFVEVKTRKGEWFDYAEDAVTRDKQARMNKAARAYCEKLNHSAAIRFDVISIVFTRYGKRLNHYRDAFYQMGWVD